MKKSFALLALVALGFSALTFTGCKKDPATDIKVTSVTIDEASATLQIGKTVTLTATVLPETAKNKTVNWDSNNKATATVSAEGVVTAVAEGHVTITATAADGSGKKDSFSLTVVSAPIAGEVSIAGDGFDIDEEQTILLSEVASTQVKVDIASARGIDKLLVEITSSSDAFNGELAGMGLAGEFDLANPKDGEFADLLSGMNIIHGDAVKGKTELPFDISSFIPLMFQVAGECTAEFTLTVSDDEELSETKTLKLALVNDTPGEVTIAGDGFDIDEEQTILLSEVASTQVKVDIASARGIDKLLVSIDSSSDIFNGALAAMGLGVEFDLANPTDDLADQLAGLENAGLSLPFGNAVKGQTELPFDISNFIPMIFAVDPGKDITAEFTLTVMDDEELSETKTLKLKLINDPQLPNAGFEDWSSVVDSSDVVQTWLTYDKDNVATRFWDTANPGLNIAGKFEDRNPTTPSDDVRPDSEGAKSVLMNSRYAKVLFVTKFAAGNLFTGEFKKVEMFKGGASVLFGQPFTGRPSALKGWFKANAGTITHAGTGAPKIVGDPDEYQIYIALTTWDKPHQVDTWDSTTFMNFTGDDVVAYGQMSGTGAQADWKEFNIELDYKSDATPTYIVIVATSSKYGDYFTGSTDSVLQVDDFELVYE